MRIQLGQRLPVFRPALLARDDALDAPEDLDGLLVEAPVLAVLEVDHGDRVDERPQVRTPLVLRAAVHRGAFWEKARKNVFE